MIAFLVLAHNAPEHLARLTKRLTSECSAVFVHIDGKSDIRAFKEVFDAGAIPVSERHKVYWGGWSVVSATLELVRTALRDPRPFTHFALISGVDYPLARPSVILDHVAKDGRQQINSAPMPAPELGKPAERLTLRKLEGAHRESGIRPLLIGVANRLLRMLPERDFKKCLNGLTPYAGSQWWVLSRDAVEAALAFERRGGSAIRMFRTSDCPDESYFQTVVSAAFAPEQIGRTMTYTDWTVPNPPAILSDEHIDRVTADGFELDNFFGRGPCFFVRKFPVDRPDLADKVDRYADARVI